MRHDPYRRRGVRAVLLVPILTLAGWMYGQSASRIVPLSPREAASIATEAYIYGYPLITSEITRIQMTNVASPEELRAPMGRLLNMRTYPPADFQGVTAPNADTLYSAGWVDVGTEPWLLSLPDLHGRYALFPVLDMWTSVLASPGKRTSGTGAQTWAVTGPQWHGTLPPGVRQIRSPGRYAFILGRVYCTGTEADYDAVHALQDRIRLYPLSSYGKPYTPRPGTVDANPGFSMTERVRDVIRRMDAATYFGMMARLMKDNPPLAQDAPIVAKMARIGLVPGRKFDMSSLDPAVQAALADVPGAAEQKIAGEKDKLGKTENGWTTPGAAGRYGTNYLARACVSDFGWGANLPQDAVYPTAEVDDAGRPLTGDKKYVVHFEKGETPPVNGFWSITMYDPSWFFAPNPLNKFTVSPRDNLKYNPDGSLDLYFQHVSPGPEKQANWLPAPEGPFIVMMRLYWPKTGTWQPPGLKAAP